MSVTADTTVQTTAANDDVASTLAVTSSATGAAVTVMAGDAVSTVACMVTNTVTSIATPAVQMLVTPRPTTRSAMEAAGLLTEVASSAITSTATTTRLQQVKQLQRLCRVQPATIKATSGQITSSRT